MYFAIAMIGKRTLFWGEGTGDDTLWEIRRVGAHECDAKYNNYDSGVKNDNDKDNDSPLKGNDMVHLFNIKVSVQSAKSAKRGSFSRILLDNWPFRTI